MAGTEAVGSLARQALDLARTELLVSLRFMNAAFSRLAYFPAPGSTLATDGAHLRYDPISIARAYAEEPASIARSYLHIVLHNVFLHTFPGAHINKNCWDVACDIVTEHAISELDLPATRTSRIARQQATLARIESTLSLITAETVYRYLLNQNLSEAELQELREPFYVDNHEPWHTMAIQKAEDDKKTKTGHCEEGEGNNTAPAMRAAEDGTDMEMPDEKPGDAQRGHKSYRGAESPNFIKKEASDQIHRSMGNRFADTVTLDRTKDKWIAAAYEMGVQLDTYAKLWGTKGSNLSMNLKIVTREKQDYREFLRKFARMGEQIRVNDDEFDYVYYCYGLTRYDNLPLIEPLEYVEEKRIRDFVIAIDTSASTKDGLVRRFIEKTYVILRHETSFFADMNVLIVQCDAAVTNVTRISSIADLESFVTDLEIQGLGGTDFRPVFAYVDNALEQGELVNLGGIIYFTDGQGTYPARKPDYDTAFVFVDDSTAAVSPPVPSWAMKIVLDETFILDEGEDIR